jgi:hypothetical protein
MARTMRLFIVSDVLVVLLLVAGRALASSPQPGTGEEWLLWTTEQRNTFIEGYVTGYMRGTRKACNVARDLYVADKSQRPGEDPSGPCLARLESYSKRSDAYITVLTDFYTSHPEYRGIPSAYLLEFLGDSRFKTADQLHQMALKGEIRTTF